MDPVSPRTGAMELVVAKDQKEYLPYPAALYETEEGRVVLLSRWRLTDEERALVASGEDFYIGLITDGNPVQPMYLQIGPEGWLRDSIQHFLCPSCGDQFTNMDETIRHVREQHT